MIFYETEWGGPGVVHLPTGRVFLPFAFPSPVQTAYAMLRSFHLERQMRDAEVKDLAVSLTTHFDPVQSATSGQVELEFERTDTSRGGIWVQTDNIYAHVRILVVGI